MAVLRRICDITRRNRRHNVDIKKDLWIFYDVFKNVLLHNPPKLNRVQSSATMVWKKCICCMYLSNDNKQLKPQGLNFTLHDSSVSHIRTCNYITFSFSVLSFMCLSILLHNVRHPLLIETSQSYIFMSFKITRILCV